jgi:hypothetical protein
MIPFRQMSMVLTALFSVLLSRPLHAESGSVWSLSSAAQPLEQIGTWERQDGQARLQWNGSPRSYHVNLLQPLPGSSPQVYVYSLVGREANAPRPGSMFGVSRALVGPQRTTNARASRPSASAVVQNVELALDLRTFTGQSIDGLWRPVETRRVSRYTAPNPSLAGSWQAVRFVVERR